MKNEKMERKKILYVIAPKDFRDEEYLIPKEVFEKNGFEVVTASKGVDVAIGVLGAKAFVNIDIKNVNIEDYMAIVFAGGGGALIYEHDAKTLEIINKFYNKGKLVAAICIAPRILGSAGILKGRQVTMWNADKEQKTIIENYGAIFTDKNVEEDGMLITGNGPIAAREFGEAVVAKLE